MFTPIGKEEADVQHLVNGIQIIQIWLSIPLLTKHQLRAFVCAQQIVAMRILRGMSTLAATSTTTTRATRIGSRPIVFESP